MEYSKTAQHVHDYVNDVYGTTQRLFASNVPSIGIAATCRRMSEQSPMKDNHLYHLGKAVETMHLGVTITNLDGKILYTNPAEARMHGYGVDDLIGKDLGVFAPPALRNPIQFDKVYTIRSLRESINVRKDGSTFPVRLMSAVVRDASGNPVAVVTTCEDITEKKLATKALRKYTRELTLLNHLSSLLQACDTEEQSAQILVDICQELFPAEPGCLCLTDPTEGTMKVVKYWGHPPRCSASLSDNPPQQKSSGVLCPHQLYCPHTDCLSAPIIASEELLGMLSLCFPHEEPQAEESQTIKSKRMLLTRVAEHYALSLANLRLREKLRREAIRDPLTGLYNRRYMEDALEREARRAMRHQSPVGIIMLDIDHFKHVNDQYGHEIGDAMLEEIGAFLLGNIRGEDIACRYGGEEFLLILPEASVEETRQRAEELRLKLKQRKFRVTISLGVAGLPDHGPDISATVRHADMALYQAKAQGRDQVVVAAHSEA